MANNIFGQPMDGGTLQNLPPNATQEQQVAVLNDVINRLNQLLKVQIFSDSTNKRMLIGYQKDGWGTGEDFGIKVSLEGVDVTEATDEQLLFKMALAQWTWRDSEGELVRDFNIGEGIEDFYSNGTLVRKNNITDGVEDFYDPITGVNYMRNGTLPDSTGGSIITKTGIEVDDVFS